MRRMYAEQNFKEYYIGLVGISVYLLISYILGVYLREFVPFPNFFLIVPSAFLSFTMYDFVNDFWHLRKIEKATSSKN